MKKYLFLLLSTVTILSFISCGSTPTAEPETKKEPPKVEEPAPVVEETAPEPEPAAEDFSKSNEELLSKADAARQKAIDAGAEKFFPEVLAADDSFYDSVKGELKDNPSADYSSKLNEVITRYEALATACMAKELKQKKIGIKEERRYINMP